MEGYMDHHSWLVSNNLLTDEMKDNISMAGYCLIEHTLDVETSIDFNTKSIEYRLLIPDSLYDNYTLLNKFERGEKIGFWKLRRLKKFIEEKKSNDESGLGYRLEEIANRFVKAYLDKQWSASVKVFSENGDEKESFYLHKDGDQPSN
jgi:hypothetical protein